MDRLEFDFRTKFIVFCAVVWLGSLVFRYFEPDWPGGVLVDSLWLAAAGAVLKSKVSVEAGAQSVISGEVVQGPGVPPPNVGVGVQRRTSRYSS